MPDYDNLFNEQDLQQLQERGISPEEAFRQYNLLRSGAYYPDVLGSASLEYGIISVSEKESPYYLDIWEEYRSSGKASITKFVPASGAASRMFQELYPLMDREGGTIEDEELSDAQREFFKNIAQFAFFNELSETCLRNNWSNVSKLTSTRRYDLILQSLLLPRGMNYADTPKGMVSFHKYLDGSVRSATTEHLVEAALYAKDLFGNVKVHFTVSADAMEQFKLHIKRHLKKVEETFSVLFDISFSTQSQSTDTLSLDADGQLFRTPDGALHFRPGGHGALLGNLNALEADIIFIKNIDNVTPDHLKGNTIRYKKLLGGILVAVRKAIFGYLEQIEKGRVSHAQLEEMLDFLKNTLCIELPRNELAGDKELLERVYAKLNRPIRVCGMVRNEGEPGGGPFVIRETDGSTSLQILEKSQFAPDEETSCKLLKSSGFFNPVDIVCCINDYKSIPFDLERFVMPRTAFISRKSHLGKELLALEHPGLWNGAMDRWNTLFVEVPNDTFSPVKTVNDLLRPEHRTLKRND